jgi:phosphoglycolate phosphatase-like HAD superfamily hydrolase
MTRLLRSIRAFVFDYDDTLVQTRECRFAAIKALAQRFYAHTMTDTDIERHWGKPFNILFQELFAEFDRDHERVINRYLALRPEFPITAHPAAVETLHTLSATYSVSIVTSASRSVVLEDVQALGFPVSQMLTIQCAEDTAHHKPDPRVFSPLQEKLAAQGIQPHQVMYVGDAATDYFAARDAGFAFTGFLPGYSATNPFEPFVVPTISDLLKLTQG